MPSKPKRPCRYPRCKALVESGYCDEHQQHDTRKRYDRDRGGSTERGYDARWQKARAAYLALHPLCVMCEQEERRYVSATIVDHIIPHKGDQELFWDEDNWQSLCKTHHDKKTAKENGFGGFGIPK